MDERILSLHQKIKTQPLELPEQSVSFSHHVTALGTRWLFVKAFCLLQY